MRLLSNIGMRSGGGGGEGEGCPQILDECVRPGRKGKGRTLSEMKVERNKRFGFNLVERRISLRPLAEGVMLGAQSKESKDACVKVTAPSDGFVQLQHVCDSFIFCQKNFTLIFVCFVFYTTNIYNF